MQTTAVTISFGGMSWNRDNARHQAAEKRKNEFQPRRIQQKGSIARRGPLSDGLGNRRGMTEQLRVSLLDWGFRVRLKAHGEIVRIPLGVQGDLFQKQRHVPSTSLRCDLGCR